MARYVPVYTMVARLEPASWWCSLTASRSGDGGARWWLLFPRPTAVARSRSASEFVSCAEAPVRCCPLAQIGGDFHRRAVPCAPRRPRFARSRERDHRCGQQATNNLLRLPLIRRHHAIIDQRQRAGRMAGCGRHRALALPALGGFLLVQRRKEFLDPACDQQANGAGVRGSQLWRWRRGDLFERLQASSIPTAAG